MIDTTLLSVLAVLVVACGSLDATGSLVDISIMYDCWFPTAGPLVTRAADTEPAPPRRFSKGLLILGIWILPAPVPWCPNGDTLHSSFVMCTVRCVTWPANLDVT